MNSTEKELIPGFRRSTMSRVRGNRMRSLVTFNPNSANPGEEIYVDIPRLSPGSCIVPGSMHLLFTFKNKGTKSWFLNNLSRLLKARLQIKLSGETVYDCAGESIYRVYQDLWLTSSARKKLIDYGIGNENLRKLMSKDDSGATSGNTEKVSDALIASVFTKLRISVDDITADHGLYAPFKMNNNFQYVVTLPPASQIMKAQTSESVDGYSLEGLELEYETIENQALADQISESYTIGRSLSYKHVTLMKTTKWLKDSTIINENINLPRKSMSAVVLMFTGLTRDDSEDYTYPNIEEVKITIEGVPNSVFSQGLTKDRFFDEASRLFCPTCEKQNSDENMTVQGFYKDGFALVVDLRSNEDDDVTGNGKNIVNTQSGVLLEITKKATTADLKCYVFVVSDGLVNFVNRDLQSIQY